LKRKIFRGRCPWNGKKTITIYIAEEKWEDLIFKFGLTADLKLITKKWWQTEGCLNYFLRRFLKIDTPPLTLAKYNWAKHLIIIYPETVILVFKVKDQDDLKKKLALRLAHEFKHAMDREGLKQMWTDAANIPPKERKIFLEKTKKNFEDMAKEFAKNFSFLFSDIIEIEIK